MSRQGRIISYREAVYEAISQEMVNDSRVFLLGEDVGAYGGSCGVLKGLIHRFGPERVRNTPISEAGFTGAAVGAAMTGTLPIVEIMYSDFFTVAMDQVVNHAAKMRYMFHGAFQVPLVIRAPSGSGTGAAAQHSQSIEAWFAHVPGLKVIMPSTPYDAKGLLTASIRDMDPVIFFEPKALYDLQGEVPVEPYEIPIGAAALRREGKDVTFITYGRMVPPVLQAAGELEEEAGISCHVLDLRTLLPLDVRQIITSAGRTGRVIIIHEAVKTGGVGAEVAACIAGDPISTELKAPVMRICGKDVPIPFARGLEQASIPSVEEIKASAFQSLSHRRGEGTRRGDCAG